MLEGRSLDFARLALDDEAAVAEAFRVSRALDFAPVVRPERRTDALVLRDAIGRLARALAAGAGLAPADVATLNSFAGDEPPVPVLKHDGSATRTAADPAGAALAALARDAIETLSERQNRLRACAGEDCGRVFIDRSRGGKRRWCSMDGCGNRVKVASYRDRTRKGQR